MARRRGVPTGVVFLLVVLLLAGLVVVGDRVAAHLTDQRVGAQLRSELGTAGAPSVDIERFPFLTQVLHGSLHSVHVVADDIPAQGPRGVDLAHVDLRLHGVTSPDRYRTFRAASVDGTATLGYASVSHLIGHPVSYRPDGQVSLTAKTTFASVPVTADVTGRPVVDVAHQTLTLGDATVSVAGLDVPESTSKELLGGMLKPVPLSGIPYHLSIRGLTATPAGLVASLSGTDVSFTR